MDSVAALKGIESALLESAAGSVAPRSTTPPPLMAADKRPRNSPADAAAGEAAASSSVVVEKPQIKRSSRSRAPGAQPKFSS